MGGTPPPGDVAVSPCSNPAPEGKLLYRRAPAPPGQLLAAGNPEAERGRSNAQAHLPHLSRAHGMCSNLPLGEGCCISLPCSNHAHQGMLLDAPCSNPAP